jgi:hypothetical protein
LFLALSVREEALLSCRFISYVVLGEEIPDGFGKKRFGGGLALHGKCLEQFMRGWRKIPGDFLFARTGRSVEAAGAADFAGPGGAGLWFVSFTE